MQKVGGAPRETRLASQADLVALVLRMARQNGPWGYTRIRGALYNLGPDLGRNTIRCILEDTRETELGDPSQAPERPSDDRAASLEARSTAR